MSETERRQGSRLEVDDERFCKRCGAELPASCFEYDTHALGGGEPPEFCGSCLGELVTAALDADGGDA